MIGATTKRQSEILFTIFALKRSLNATSGLKRLRVALSASSKTYDPFQSLPGNRGTFL